MDQIKPENLELILLTGCIDTMGMHFTSLQNMEVRKAQYVEAINFLLKTQAMTFLLTSVIIRIGNDLNF
jgi:NO-binding membrane sensor protein with MHYT domain